MLQGVSNLISRSLKKKKKISLIGRNVLIKITLLTWIFLGIGIFPIPCYSTCFLTSPPESWKTAVLLWKLGVVKCRRHRRHFETKTFNLRRLLNVAKPRVKFAARAAIHPARESLKRMQRTDQPCVICVLVVVRCTWKKKEKDKRERD